MSKIMAGYGLIILTMLLLSGSAIAEGQQGTFAVVDSRQGAIRCNTRTGQCWLLDTSSDLPTWRPVREPSEEKRFSSSPMRVDDIEWKVIIDETGKAIGIQVLKIKEERSVKGLIAGDVVTGLNDNSVASVADLRRLLRTAIQSDEAVKLSVIRDDKKIVIELDVQEE